MNEIFGRDNRKPYLFTGLQILRIVRNYKEKIIKWEWNNVDGYKFFNRNGKKLKRIPFYIKSLVEERKNLFFEKWTEE